MRFVLGLVLALSAASAAHAEALAAIPSVDVFFPEDSTPLPLNARPVAFSRFGKPADVAFELLRGGVSTPLQFEEQHADRATAYLLDLGPLTADETITVAGQCPVCRAAVTYAVASDSDDTPPTFADGDAEVEAVGLTGGSFDPFTKGYEIHATIPPATDDRGPVLVRVAGDEGVDLFIPPTAPPGHFFVDGGGVRTYCFRVIAVDVAGNEAEFPDELCTDFADAAERGCSSSPVMPAALALVLLFVRRRRS